MIQIFAAIIALAALFARGFTGFGSSLIMTPLLMLFLDAKAAVTAAALTQVPVGFWIAFESRSSINKPYLKLLLPPSILGIIVGSFALVNFDSDLLKRVFGLITVIFAIRIMLAVNQGSAPGKRWPLGIGYLVGALGGVLGGAFGTSGPPIIVYLEKQVDNKDVLRATLLAYFLATDCLRLTSYALAKLVTWQVFFISLAMIPAALIGAYWGARLSTNVGEGTFRLIVGVLLFATGVLLAIR